MNGNRRLKEYRRWLLSAVIMVQCSVTVDAATVNVDSSTFQMIQQRAAALAAEPYVKQSPDLPPFLADLNYDQYRDIRFPN